MKLELTDEQAKAMLRALGIAAWEVGTPATATARAVVEADRKHWDVIAKQLTEKITEANMLHGKSSRNLPR